MRLPRRVSLSLRARFLLGIGVMLLPLVVLASSTLFSFQNVTNAMDDVVEEVGNRANSPSFSASSP
ncbi:MAG: hypothetical protein MZV49_15450 [Rhodopseudomonas palustris]|nr:hypothetical protein [Rhodopseudomonas palustris]